jgi:hypothetical protein
MPDSNPTIEGIAKSFEKGLPARLIAGPDAGLLIGGARPYQGHARAP